MELGITCFYEIDTEFLLIYLYYILSYDDAVAEFGFQCVNICYGHTSRCGDGSISVVEFQDLLNIDLYTLKDCM